MKLVKGLITSDEDENIIMSKDTFYEMDNNFNIILKENKQLKEENEKITDMLYKYRRNINQLHSYLSCEDGIAIICDIKKLFEILGDKENE